MKFQSLIILIFVGLLGLFFEARKEIGEEVELIAYNFKAKFHSHQSTGKILAVKLPDQFSDNPEILLSAMEQVAEKKPFLAAFFVQATELPVTKHNLDRLFKLLEDNKNFNLGFIGTLSDEPIFKKAPPGIADQLRSAPTARVYNKDIITSIPSIDDTAGKTRETLVPWLALKSISESEKKEMQATLEAQTDEHKNANSLYELGFRETPNKLPTIKINYYSTDSIIPITYEEYLSSADSGDKIVYLYSPKFKPRIPAGPEATFANTPWQKKELGDDLDHTGVHVAIIQAIALDNLISGKELKKAPEMASFILLVVACLFAFFIWEYSPDNAVAITLAVAAISVLIFSQLESLLGADIPLARPLVFGCLCSIAGAFHATSRSIRAKAKAKIDSESEAEMSKVHESFLDSFSMKLLKDTSAIMQLTNKLKNAKGIKLEGQLQELIGSCSELKEYLQGINQFAAIRNGSAGLPRKKHVLVKPLIDRLLGQLEPEQKNILVENRLTEESYLVTDPLYLEPILFNLISNAIKYSPPGSKIEILSEEKKNYILSLRVRDEGPGIADELKERVFEKFYRIKDDRAFVVKGSGLGLYLSRFFSDALQLGIHVENAPHKGSDFVITRRGA